MLSKIDKLCIAAMVKWNTLLTDEEGDVNIVSIVVLCGIVIALAVVFRKQLKNLIESVMGDVTTNATTTVNEPA